MKTRAQALGEAIGKDRARTGASQEEAAAAVGVTQQAFSRWEKGESIPRTARLLKLRELFGPDSHTGMVVGYFVPEDVLQGCNLPRDDAISRAAKGVELARHMLDDAATELARVMRQLHKD